jgi:hypothetical protein
VRYSGVILRGGGWLELWPNALALWTMAIAVLVFSSFRLKKQLA